MPGETKESVRFLQTGKEKLKEMAKSFLGGLLCRPEMTGTMGERQVKKAIRSWIPGFGGVGEIMRGSDSPGKNLSVPKQSLKREIKKLHPSCSIGTLKSLSNKGIRRVEAILGFFCQALVQQVAGFALSRAICAIKGHEEISDDSLMDADTGIVNLRDPTLRKLLQLETIPADNILEGSDHSEKEKQRAEKLLGKKFKKFFTGRGYFDGCIESFDPVKFCFKVSPVSALTSLS